MADSKYTVQDLQDNLAYLEETKRQIKQAIIDKGQSVSNEDTFRSYAGKIGAIETGIDTSDATALASDIIAPKTAYVANGKVTGSIMPIYTPEKTLVVDEYTIECDTTSTGDMSQLLAVTEDGKWILAPALTTDGEHGLGVFSVIDGNITLIKAYSFSYLGMTYVNYSLFSLSKSIGDNRHILWYADLNSNILNARIIDFNDTTDPISNTAYTYTANDVIRNIVVNPNLTNQVLVTRYENHYIQWILICSFDVDTNSIIVVNPEQQCNVASAESLFPIHISADGTKVIFSGAEASESAFDTYLFSLSPTNGTILSVKQITDGSGGTGMSPDGNYVISRKKLYKLNGIDYNLIGETSFIPSHSSQCMFIGSSNHIVTSDDDKIFVYDMDLNTGNQKSLLFNLSLYGIANNVTNQNELWALSTNRTKIQRIYSNVTLSGFNRNGINYRDTSDATASENDIVSGKTAYVNNEKITGTVVEDVNTSMAYELSAFNDIPSMEMLSVSSVDLPFDRLVRAGCNYSMNIPYETAVNTIGLTADKIKAGETILGIIGNVKFDSFDEYNTCNELAKNIFSQDVVWDIYNLPDLPNDGYDEYVVYNYDSTINLLKLADTALFIGHTANQSTGTIFYRANGKQYKLENSTWVEINLVTSYEPTNDMQFIYSSFDVSYDGYWTNVTGNPIYFNKNVIPEYKSELIARLNAILNDKNTNVLPENIKLNKTILGVTGTYEPNYAELGTISPEEYTIAEDTANDILGKEVL